MSGGRSSAADGGDIVVQPGTTGQTLRFTVANTGNGSEAFLLSARNSLSADDFDPSAFAIYLDSNGNGIFDVGVDQAYVSGAGNPTIAADGSITVFIVSHGQMWFAVLILVVLTENSRLSILIANHDHLNVQGKHRLPR